jgi:hypothetical protein
MGEEPQGASLRPERVETGARLLFWDYARGSWPYDLLCLLLVALIVLVPPSWWGDPLFVAGR